MNSKGYLLQLLGELNNILTIFINILLISFFLYVLPICYY